jgi:N-acyl-D-aspartate/D-glutamate deacylase
MMAGVRDALRHLSVPDAQIHWDPYLTISSWHGVTSITMGNCGFGFAPLHPQDAERAMLALSRNEAIPLEPMKASMDFKWSTFPQYLDRLERLPRDLGPEEDDQALRHVRDLPAVVARAAGIEPR